MKIRSFKGAIELSDYFQKVHEFHGRLAPGVVLGGFMVDWAMEVMESSHLLDAVVETRKCLPDAVQLLTSCTTGNGWLKILDWGILAVTLYDKETRYGARIHLDMEKVPEFPQIKAWAMKERPKQENPLNPLIGEMVEAGRRILTCRKVVLETIPDKYSPYAHPRICFKCGEAFRYGPGHTCQRCTTPFHRIT